MEKGAKTNPGFSPRLGGVWGPTFLGVLLGVSRGKCPTHSGSIQGWDFMLGNQDPGSTKKEKDDKKGSKKKLGQPETFLRNE